MRLPIATRDRLLRGEAVIGAVGPIVVPTRSAMVKALITLALCGPHTRVGLGFDLDGKTWKYDPERLAEWCDEIVVDLPPASPETIVEVASRQAWLLDTDHPLRFALAGDYVIQVNDHALGDGVLFVDRLATVIRLASGDTELPDWAHHAPVAFPLRRAIIKTFLRTRGGLRALVADRRADKDSATEPTEGEGVTWRPEMTVVYTTVAPAAMTEIKQWTRAIDPSLSLSAGLIVLLRRGLAAAGVPAGPATSVIYNLRRYLPPGSSVVSGNFISALPIRVRQPDDAREIGARMRRHIESGRPLMALVLGVVRARVFGVPLAVWHRVDSVARADLFFNNMGKAEPFESLPWKVPPLQRNCVIVTRPGSPESITVLVVMVAGVLHVTAAFHSNVFGEAAVADALNRAATQPRALLDGMAPRGQS